MVAIAGFHIKLELEHVDISNSTSISKFESVRAIKRRINDNIVQARLELLIRSYNSSQAGKEVRRKERNTRAKNREQHIKPKWPIT